MAPARRSSVHSGPGLLDSLPVMVKVLIAQAVHQEGTANWAKVAAILKNHPLLNKLEPAYVVKQDVAHKAFEAMLDRAGLQIGKVYPPEDPALDEVARIYFAERIAQLQALMQHEQDKFRSTYADLTAIQSGAWDDRYADPDPSSDHATPATPIIDRDSLPPLPIPEHSPPPVNLHKPVAVAKPVKSPRAALPPLPSIDGETQEDTGTDGEHEELGNHEEVRAGRGGTGRTGRAGRILDGASASGVTRLAKPKKEEAGGEEAGAEEQGEGAAEEEDEEELGQEKEWSGSLGRRGSQRGRGGGKARARGKAKKQHYRKGVKGGWAKKKDDEAGAEAEGAEGGGDVEMAEAEADP